MRRSPLRRKSAFARPGHDGEAERWHAEVAYEPCAMCGNKAQRMDGHHALYKSHLKAYGLADWMHDRRNRLALCRGCHDSHHHGVTPVTRDRLVPANFEFASERGLLWLLLRTYPVPTEREAA